MMTSLGAKRSAPRISGPMAAVLVWLYNDGNELEVEEEHIRAYPLRSLWGMARSFTPLVRRRFTRRNGSLTYWWQLTPDGCKAAVKYAKQLREAREMVSHD